MPSSRHYGSLLPERGESHRALLSDRASSATSTRQYGPSVSSAPISANSALLSTQSKSSDRSIGGSSAEQSAPWGGYDHSFPEADDEFHNPDPKRDRRGDHGGTIFTGRGIANIGCLFVLLLGIITLFGGYPIITWYNRTVNTTSGYNLGGINGSGQVPDLANFPTPIDPATPDDVRTRTGFDGEQYTLVFSDEFNRDGRTFYEGDDPYWTAVDFHYWPTGDFEWYDPSSITTKDGNLVITMTQEQIHDLNFKSGMLQSWNQVCFQYSAYFEVRVSLPGTPDVGGFWPGVWMMGNLGRPGYGGTTEGLWPYSYDACDIGTLPNQTYVNGTGPAAALADNGLSYLPGQRLSACTCKGEDHPGPDVSYGRSAPEIDVIEAQTDLSIPRGQVSQSNQIAPFDAGYYFANKSANVVQYDTSKTKWNSYKGGVYQQSVSSLTYIDRDNYQLTSGGFGVFGMEFYTNPNSRDSGHITWVSDGVKSWTMYPSAIGPNSKVELSQRILPEEPMAMVINFGMSNNFQTVDFDNLQWPAQMLIDYVRVYQRSDGKMGCDPSDRPTAAYIAKHRAVYDNPNITTWAEGGNTFPKNRLQGC